MKYAASPNFNDRAPGIKLEYIVLHYTGMKNEASAIERLRDPNAEVSAHYVICENGNIIQLVSETHRAWHAGQSFWRGITDLNSASIGIELVNPGHEFGYRPFPQLQINALKKLLHEIISRHKMNPKLCLLAHSDIAPTRKEDPGELFPWKELADEGLGSWPEASNASEAPPVNQTEMISLVSEIGYNISTPQDAIRAFQRHYCPENLTGIADGETIKRLRSIAQNILN